MFVCVCVCVPVISEPQRHALDMHVCVASFRSCSLPRRLKCTTARASSLSSCAMRPPLMTSPVRDICIHMQGYTYVCAFGAYIFMHALLMRICTVQALMCLTHACSSIQMICLAATRQGRGMTSHAAYISRDEKERKRKRKRKRKRERKRER